MIYSNVGYCVCGREVWLEYLRDGQAWKVRFLDADHQEITHCPDCGRPLDEDELESL